MLKVGEKIVEIDKKVKCMEEMIYIDAAQMIIIDLLIYFKSANFYLYLFNKSLLYNDSSVVEYDKFFINISTPICPSCIFPLRKVETNIICGTPHCLTPEIIIGKGYSYSADYCSLGITMFELFYVYLPFGQGVKEPMNIYYEFYKESLNLIEERKMMKIISK